jgi:hypothetical protein
MRPVPRRKQAEAGDISFVHEPFASPEIGKRNGPAQLEQTATVAHDLDDAKRQQIFEQLANGFHER